MTLTARDRSYLGTLLLCWAALFLFRISETSLKTDGLTFSAISKKMLESRDWTVPTYTHSAYETFYMHPPLFFWLQATAFKVAGVSDVTARIVPALFALGTLLVLYAFGTWLLSEWLGLLSAIVLLLSYPYVKYASDAYLDGPMSFFLILGLYGLARLHDPHRVARWGAVLGVALWGGFMTKGLASVGFVAVVVGYAVLLPFLPDKNRGEVLKGIGIGFAVAGLLFLLWFQLGAGLTYLREYWATSVAGRLKSPSLAAHFSPFPILFRDYWLWLPAWFFALVKVAPIVRTSAKARLVALTGLTALSIPVGFAVSGHFYECYGIPFLVCGALLVAFTLEKFLRAKAEPIRQFLTVLCLAFALFCAIYPHRIRTARTEPIRVAAPRVAAHFPREALDEIVISHRLADRWDGLAVVLWATPWHATWVTTIPAAPAPKQLLLAAPGDPIPKAWAAVPELDGAGYSVYRAKN